VGIVYGAHLKAIGVYMSVFRSLLLLAVFLSGSIASAFAPSSMYYTTNGYRVSITARFASPSELCNKIMQEFVDNNPERTYSVSSAAYPDGCWINEYGSGGAFLDRKPFNVSLDGAACPANSVKVGADCVCNAGLVEQGGQCVDPNQACQAKSGTSSIVNVTVAWQRTPSVASGVDWLYPTKLSSSGTGSACNGGCMQNFDAHEPCADCGSYVSQVPNSQGLYRVSIDFMGHYSGSACSDSPSDQVIKPDDSKDPPCPGFVGEVNGVKGCYGTADKPVRPSAPDPNLDKNGKDQGNPAAGTKPTSGSGSGSGGAGRTPGAGSGGSAGGPAGAANGSGTKPDGTKPTEEGKEQQNCGAPGQPKCGIDESGTPKTYTGSDGLADWKAAADSNRAQIKDSGGGVFDGFAIFFSAPPVASCSPFDLPNDYGSLDPCPVVDGVRGVMGYIWALGALFLCIGWIREAI